MVIKNSIQGGIAYLDMQAYVGITKHIGGRAATDELLARCHVDNACEVLNVGCGIGVGTAYIAKKYGCHVVGVDISEKMIEWSRKRAKREHVQDKTEFRAADILDLPLKRIVLTRSSSSRWLRLCKTRRARFVNVCG